MILVRDIFRVRFGMMRDALAALKAAEPLLAQESVRPDSRILTDLTGPYYTLVLESTFVDLAAWETYSKEGMSSPEWKDWYHRFSANIESGHREIMTIVA